MKRAIRFLTNLLPSYTAYAHCDVPCGIYDPKAAQTAAATMLRMVQIIQETPEDRAKTLTERNRLIRAIMTKEEHGRICKHELFTLWADYFKPEHLEKYPDLHDKFWKAAKLVSKNKQEVNLESAQALVKAVDEIAAIFAETKASK